MQHATRALMLFAVSVLLAACSQIDHIPARTDVSGINLRPLTEAGFLVTPGDYTGGEFEAMGIVTVTVWPEANKLSRGEAEERGLDTGGRPAMWVEEEITMQQALQQTREQAEEMGADALTHFDVQSVTRTTEGPSISGIQVTGFAIDRRGEGLAGE